MAGPLLKLNRIPQVLWYTHKSVTLMLKLGVFFSDTVVTASRGSLRVNTPKKKAIGHGIDTKLFDRNPKISDSDQPFRIISVGRIMPVKRLDLAIDLVHLRSPNKKLSLF